MTDKQKLAVELKNRTGDAHYNCCQAVACMFSKETGISEDVLKRIGAGFGLGMGGMEGTCGALCGAEMILGLTKYKGSPIRNDAKELHRKFTEMCGGSICRELKGVGTGKVLCSCDDCVKNAVAILEDTI